MPEFDAREGWPWVRGYREGVREGGISLAHPGIDRALETSRPRLSELSEGKSIFIVFDHTLNSLLIFELWVSLQLTNRIFSAVDPACSSQGPRIRRKFAW